VIIKGGAIHFRHQCLQCGESIGNAIAKSACPKDSPAYDEALYERYQKERADKYENIWQKHVRQQKITDTEFWTRYNGYLNSAEWKAKRTKVLRRARDICEGCLEKSATQVHHLTYAHVFNECLFELVAVCDECHERIHAHDTNTEDLEYEWSDCHPCCGCRWQSEQNNRRWCSKFDILAQISLSADGPCGPKHVELEPLR
jgi:hypothetical protein